MKTVIVHAGLLGVMLLAAFVTWTGDENTTGPEEASVVVWQGDADDVTAVSYQSDERVVRIERQGRAGDAYLWARDSTIITPPPVRDTVQIDTAAKAPQTRVDEYPVGDAGVTLFEELGRLRAVRDLGEATEENRKTYGLDGAGPEIIVHLRNGAERKLVLGRNVVGGGDRYAHEPERNQIYVLSSSLLRPLESRDVLRLTEYQPFTPDEIGSATVQTASAQRTMRRRVTGSPERVVWSPADSERADEGFASFMEQIDRLWVSSYVTDVSPDTLQSILRIDYFNERGSALGFLELHRTRGEESTYLMRTGRTIVFGEVYAPQAERIEQDVATLFRPAQPAAEANARADSGLAGS